MKRRIPIFALLLAAFAFTAPAVAHADEPAGKKVFTAKRCNFCHSIKAEKIAQVGKTPAGEAQAPDLSDVGLKHDAAWMHKFLKKKVALDGKKHKKFFIGADKDLKNLTAWLATLKAKNAGTAK